MSKEANQRLPTQVFESMNPIEVAENLYHNELWHDNRTNINFIWGIKPVLWSDGEHSAWSAQTDGGVEIDKMFKPSNMTHQKALADFCEKLVALESEGFVLENCPMKSFKNHSMNVSDTFPWP